ncbi:MAG: FAD-dependent oxidoreductase [Deltaproteobacteria bacterium]
MSELSHLMQTIRIKSMEVPNRLVMPPMGTGLAHRDGTVSQANLAYLERRARGGAGLIITEITSVHPRGTAAPGTLCAYDDFFISGLAQMVQVVHACGSKIAMQLHHAGRESFYQLQKGQALGPSAVPSYVYGMKPNEMNEDDINEVIQAFGSAALRARKAGFDAVELHAAHGYLLMQFLSAHSNHRTDKYGGDLGQRARFVVECLQEVRKQVGLDFPISLRISGEEMIKNGYGIEDMVHIVPQFIEVGADILHVSFGTHGTPGGMTCAPIEYQPGFKIGLARLIKEAIDVPVIGVGRFTDPAAADEVIKRGDADMIAVGRQHLCDPDFLVNALNGRSGSTLTCLACNQGCIERLAFEQKSVRCAINPETGQELIYPREVASNKRRVWVIGGGPAGLTAASEAARLGHEVTLFEKSEQVGGQVLLAARAPFKEPYGRFIEQLAARARENGAVIKTSSEVKEADFDPQSVDMIILASGGQNIKLDLPGADLPLVRDAWELLRGEVPVGDQVVVIGGGLIGMEAADYLYAHGAGEIMVIEAQAQSPVSTLTSHGYMLHKRLRQAGFRMAADTMVKGIESNAVVIERDGKEEKIPVDQVVVAAGTRPVNSLKATAEARGINCTVVGDAAVTRRIIEAVEEGARAAWEIS